ncbi:MAG TPA: acetyltransferase [Methylomirabilota bacterium]|jgi:sugar O-acyltransferase (sialic acid O-acetyltransferase NeuD family)|nr:acetyltransferase [Methylomirabilota bacterium]
MKPIVIFGTGDIARLARVYFTRDARRDVAGFTVDAAYCTSPVFQELPLVPFEEVAARFPPAGFELFVALSYRNMNRLREEKYRAAKALGYALASYVSSRCSFLSDIPVGDNCFILEDNTVQPFVRIGSNVTLWSGNHIGHDSTIDDHCFVSSHVVVSGHVRIGSHCFLGVNATLRNGITLARETLVGAGAVIMKDTVEKGVYLAQRAERFAKSSDQIDL